jgi:5-(carboxyamino)imidazole ribonucleotide synthase
MDGSESAPARAVSSSFTIGSYLNYDDVLNFGRGVDMITFEIENVNIDALRQLKSEGIKILPDPDALELISDKGTQKEFYQDNNIPSSPFTLYQNKEEVLEAISNGTINLPFVQKLRRMGYDGRGVQVIKSESDLENLFAEASLVEDLVDLEKEISVIVARNAHGQKSSFSTVEMEFNPVANLVELLISPADVTEDVENKAHHLAEDIVEKLDYVGLMAVEMFVTKSGEVLVNEVAPRTHNSGHHTIESCITSQYEQQLRAVLDLPLGKTTMKSPAIMLNLLGEPGYEGSVKYDGFSECLDIEGVNVHIYGKAETRPFRKMGHVTILDETLEGARKKATFVKDNLKVIA